VRLKLLDGQTWHFDFNTEARHASKDTFAVQNALVLMPWLFVVARMI